eukprot:5175737-Prymnesium_polylepis.1
MPIYTGGKIKLSIVPGAPADGIVCQMPLLPPVMGNSVSSTRRRNIDFFGYPPLAHEKPICRAMLLMLMPLFVGGFLTMVASSSAAAALQNPRTVAAVLAADCALAHAWKLYEGEWWVFGQPLVRSFGLAAAIPVDILISSLFWL